MTDDRTRAMRDHDARVNASRGAANGVADLGDAETAAIALADLLKLPTVGMHIASARIVGQGSRASADLTVSDGHRQTTITFESMREFGTPKALALEIVTCTGAQPKLTAELTMRAVSLLRTIASHVAVTTADALARDWGVEFLRQAVERAVDMDDQADRWAAFAHLGTIDPDVRHRLDGLGIAAASVVLRHRTGVRYVRTDWFAHHVRVGEHISRPEIANRMMRLGWERPGAEGRVKASEPGFGRKLVWSFYVVPERWESDE